MLSPTVAGVFAHESFGHKSESDFMLGSETMRREWELGKRVGWEGLSILDSGVPNGSGYCPYDDEGTRARDTYLVKNGVLTGRLHSAATAAALDEAVTGNARAISFEFEPIVRMTSTWTRAARIRLRACCAGPRAACISRTSSTAPACRHLRSLRRALTASAAENRQSRCWSA